MGAGELARARKASCFQTVVSDMKGMKGLSPGFPVLHEGRFRVFRGFAIASMERAAVSYGGATG